MPPLVIIKFETPECPSSCRQRYELTALHQRNVEESIKCHSACQQNVSKFNWQDAQCNYACAWLPLTYILGCAKFLILGKQHHNKLGSSSIESRSIRSWWYMGRSLPSKQCCLPCIGWSHWHCDSTKYALRTERAVPVWTENGMAVAALLAPEL